MIDAVRGDESRAAIAGRVEADLSLAFPDVVVMFNDNGQAEVRTAEWSGVAGLIIDGDDQLSDYDVEQATASMTEDIADNLWRLVISDHNSACIAWPIEEGGVNRELDGTSDVRTGRADRCHPLFGRRSQ